jgi:hypothetical protein
VLRLVKLAHVDPNEVSGSIPSNLRNGPAKTNEVAAVLAPQTIQTTRSMHPLI